MPGYGFSDKPTRTGWGVERIADAWAELMTALGYERFGAQGGDWGSAVTTAHRRSARRPLHRHPPQHGVGAPGRRDELTEAEQAAVARLEDHRKWGVGYSTQQSTRPQTLGLRAGRLAGGAGGVDRREVLGVGRPRRHARRRGQPRPAARQRHALLAARRRRLVGPPVLGELQPLPSQRADQPCPSAMSIFPKEIFTPSRRWAEERFTDIRHWNELDHGGHFAAFEQPERVRRRGAHRVPHDALISRARRDARRRRCTAGRTMVITRCTPRRASRSSAGDPDVVTRNSVGVATGARVRLAGDVEQPRQRRAARGVDPVAHTAGQLGHLRTEPTDDRPAAAVPVGGSRPRRRRPTTPRAASRRSPRRLAGGPGRRHGAAEGRCSAGVRRARAAAGADARAAAGRR